MRNIVPGFLGALLCGPVALLALLCGCGEPARILVSVGNLPARTTTLAVAARLGQTPFETQPEFPVDFEQLPADGRYSFGLRIPDRSSGKLQVSVGALIDEGAGTPTRRCLVGTAKGEIALQSDGAPTLNIDLTESPSVCNIALPIVQQAAQDIFTGRPRLTLRGFGFVTGATVLIDDQPDDFVVSPSPLELTTDPPTVTSPSGAQQVGIQVRMPSGALSNRLNYSVTQQWLEPPQSFYQSTTTANDITIYTGAVLEDFNNDSKQDLAVSGYIYHPGTGTRGSGFVQLFLNSGTGLSDQGIISPVWTDVPTVDPAEVTANALVSTTYRKAARDLIVAIGDSKGRGGFIVLSNNGNGTFTTTSINLLDGAYPNISALAHVDIDQTLDAKGHPDLVLLSTASDGSSQLMTFLSDVNGTPMTMLYFAIGIGKNASGLKVADLNKDGAMDFAVIATNTGDMSKAQVHVALNYRNGKIYPSYADSTMLTNIEGLGGGLASGDFLGDGDTYLIASNYALNGSPGTSLSVVRNHGFGTMHPANGEPVQPAEPVLTTLPQRYSVGAQPFSLVAMDADHDGGVDILTALSGQPGMGGSSGTPTRIAILRNLRVSNYALSLFPGGNGQAVPLPTLSLGDQTYDDTMLSTGDISGDGFTDLVAVVRGSGPAKRGGAIWISRSL